MLAVHVVSQSCSQRRGAEHPKTKVRGPSKLRRDLIQSQLGCFFWLTHKTWQKMHRFSFHMK